jgi:hypothetical protein
MAEKIRTLQTPTLAWAASSVVSQDIKASGAITELILKVAVTYSAPLIAAAIKPDGIWRIMNSITIKGNGGISYLSMGDQEISRMLHVLNLRDKLLQGTGRYIVGGTTQEYLYVLHFGSRIRDQFGLPNPFDMSAFIPAFKDTGLRIEWGTTANSVVDAAITISSAVMSITVNEVLGTAQELRAEMAKQGVRQAMFPQSNYFSYPHTGTFSDVSHDIDVPAGAFLRRIAIMAQTEASPALRADDEITQVALKLPVGNQRVFFDGFSTLSLQQGTVETDLVTGEVTTPDGIVQAPGIAVMDLRQQADKEYGLDLRGYKTGDLKLGVTIGSYAAGDDSFYWFDQLRPLEF